MAPSTSPDGSLSEAYLGKRLEWAKARLAHLEPDYRFRWEIYFDRLEELAQSAECFLDAGCGDNRTADELDGPTVRVGLDVHDQTTRGTFIKGRLETIPFADSTFDLVGCRYVVEHLDTPLRVFDELRRVMRPGGRLLIQTVNRDSFLIRLSRRLGGRLRGLISRHRYARDAEDIFPVVDRFNTPDLFESPPEGFRLVSLWMTQDVDVQSRLGFYLTYQLLRRTRNRPATRSTITAEWERL